MTVRYRYRTPGTKVWWDSVQSWIAAAHTIASRRLSHHRNRALEDHGSVLPREVINLETDITVIENALYLLKYGYSDLCRPQRGKRAEAPQTRVIMDLMNRRKVLMDLEKSSMIGHNSKAFDEGFGKDCEP